MENSERHRVNTDQQNDFARIEFLFSVALDIPPDERDEWLAVECKNQPTIFEEVKSLLTAHDDSGDFLTGSLDLVAILTGNDDGLIAKNLLGQRIGAYEIVSQLGQGGMGSVFLAKRADGEYEQLVAIKFIMRASLEEAVIRRERQILADLNHSNIVHILDAGRLPEGIAYFVMEYVDGDAINVHWQQLHQQLADKDQSDQASLPIEKQATGKLLLEQMAEIASIVHQAHLHGVIHCDLKPSNILFSKEGKLKLLDFGIAQANDGSYTAGESSDKPQSFALTPDYSSPQRHQQKLPTIADDVFSLGILFAQALTGKKPAMLQVDRYLPEPDIESIADDISNPELKHIFFKATHPVREQRYSSARAFSADIRNWLEHRPVSAIDGGAFYELGKNMRRNWGYWLRGVIAVMLIAVVVGVWLQKQYHARQNTEVQELARNMLSELDITLESLPKTTLIREKLIHGVHDRIVKLDNKHPGNIAIQTILANTLNRLAEVTGHPYALNQGNIDQALEYYKQSLSIYEAIVNKRDDYYEAHEDIANTHRKIAEILAYKGDVQGGLEIMKAIREQAESIFLSAPIDKQIPLIIVYTVEAHGYFHLGNYDRAQALIDKAWKIANEKQPKETIYHQLVVAFLQEETGHLALLKQEWGAAKKAYQSVVDNYRGSDLWQHRLRLVRSHNGLACLHLRDNREDLALQEFQSILDGYSVLNKRYPNAEMIQNQLFKLGELMTVEQPQRQQLESYLNCQTPLAFMLPPQQLEKSAN